MLKRNAIEHCLNFETDYILNKKEIIDLKSKSEINRLSNLKTRNRNMNISVVIPASEK